MKWLLALALALLLGSTAVAQMSLPAGLAQLQPFLSSGGACPIIVGSVPIVVANPPIQVNC